MICGKWRGASGGSTELGRVPFKEPPISTHKQAEPGPELNLGAKLKGSAGGKISGSVAVKLFAGAPERDKRRESRSIEKSAWSAFPGSSAEQVTPEPRSISKEAFDSD